MAKLFLTVVSLMKTYIVIATLLITAIAAVATPIIEFKGWDDLIQTSPDIIIAKRAPQPLINLPINHPTAITVTDGVIQYPIEVVSALKGGAKLGPALLWSPYSFRRGDVLPRHGDMFLVFSSNGGNDSTNLWYKANEDYRVVIFAPDVDSSAWTNALAGKPLKEQVGKILQYRLDTLNQELARGEAEKQRLEDGIQKLGK